MWARKNTQSVVVSILDFRFFLTSCPCIYTKKLAIKATENSKVCLLSLYECIVTAVVTASAFVSPM